MILTLFTNTELRLGLCHDRRHLPLGTQSHDHRETIFFWFMGEWTSGEELPENWTVSDGLSGVGL